MKRMTRIIAISSGKGGVGKTTTATNLGAVLASIYNKKVVVIDCNLTNPHVGLSLGTLSVWPVTLNQVLKNQAHIDHALYTHSSGVKIVPASFEAKDMKRMQMGRLRTRLKTLFERQDTDIVLLDSSPGLTNESLLSLRCADEVLFVATPHIPSIVDITKCIHVIEQMKIKPLGLILNRVTGKKYEMGPEEIKTFTTLPILAHIPEDEKVLQSTNFKSPVTSSFPHSPASRAFVSLGAMIARTEAPALATPGFFSRLFGRFRN